MAAITLSDGTGTAYYYDALGRQTAVRAATVTSSGDYQVASGSEQAVFAYDENTLASITTGSTTYTFTYDVYKNRKSVKVGSGDIAYYIYAANNGKLIYTVYANGYVTKNVYDAVDRLSEVWCAQVSGTLPSEDSAYDSYTYSRKEGYLYDDAGNVAAVIDYVAGEKTVYSYDANNRPTVAMRFDETGGTVTVTFVDKVTYNSVGLVSGAIQYYTLGSTKYTNNHSFAYDSRQRLTTLFYGTTSSANRCDYVYDDFNRLSERALVYGGLAVSQSYFYEWCENSYDDNATARVDIMMYGIGNDLTEYDYSYDARGNITEIYIDGVLKYSYQYDDLDQLVRENNAVANKTYVYTYDNAGNILTKKTYAYTTGTLGSVQSTNTYTYGNTEWGDQLTGFNGTAITYDALGNPKTYYDGSSFLWKKGRNLVSIRKSGKTVIYEYNADGIRTYKYVNGVETDYVVNGSQILAEKRGDTVIRYLYDENGLPIGMIYDGTTYLYEKSLQGDVIGIYNTSGTKVVTYVYDAWGKVISSSCVSGYSSVYTYNPFRYRGYYYDAETGFYYLQSRYYDPTTGRFLNADGYINANGDLQGFNMYAYCSNNPVMYADYTGEWTRSIGLSFSAFVFTGFSYSYSLSFDGLGNVAIQKTKANPFVKESGVIIGLYSIGVGITHSKTDLESVYDLEGPSLSVGGSISKHGWEQIITFENPSEVIGKTRSYGVGKGVDIHMSNTVTETVWSFNYFDYIENSLNRFKERWNNFWDRLTD